jgi:hypothetical protein
VCSLVSATGQLGGAHWAGYPLQRGLAEPTAPGASLVVWLLCELLAVTVPPASQEQGPLPRIVLIDATRLKEPGGSGDNWRVHLGYDLLAGRLVDVRVADRHMAEAFELFEVGPGDVLVADRGYSRRRKSGLCAGAWSRRGRPPSRAASSPAR